MLKNRISIIGFILASLGSVISAPMEQEITPVSQDINFEVTHLDSVNDLVDFLTSKKIFGGIEGDDRMCRRHVEFANGETASLKDVLEKMQKSVGFKYDVRNGKVFIYDPDLRKLPAADYPMNAVIPEIKISHATPHEALYQMETKYHLRMLIGTGLGSRKASKAIISLDRRNLTLRDAIQAISDAAGGLPWRVTPFDLNALIKPRESKGAASAICVMM